MIRLESFLMLCALAVSSTQASALPNGEILESTTIPSGRKVEKLQWSETQYGYVLVSYPRNFDAKKPYHINFAFPGTGGRPKPGIEDQNDQYIGILMSYLDQQNTSNEQYARDHWQLCRKVEASLRNRVPIEVGQRIVSGVSKGGWLTFQMALLAPEGLDGVAIIAAGRDMHAKKAPNLSRSGLSVFVGTGETDTNYPFAQLATPYFRECGIRDYTYEEWLGKGHTSVISPRVQEWLNMVAMRSEPKERFIKYCEGEVDADWQEIKKLPNVLEQYWAARHLIKSPCMLHVSADFRAKVAAWGRELGEDPKVSAWTQDYNRLRKIVRAEAMVYETAWVETKHLLKVDAQYRRLAADTKHPDIRKRAAYAHDRNRKVITMLELREKARKEPAHIALEEKAKELQRQVSNLNGKKDDALMKEFEQVRRELGAKSGKLRMDSFYQVEWEGKYTLHEEMKTIIDEPAKEPSKHSAYSGLNY